VGQLAITALVAAVVVGVALAHLLAATVERVRLALSSLPIRRLETIVQSCVPVFALVNHEQEEGTKCHSSGTAGHVLSEPLPGGSRGFVMGDSWGWIGWVRPKPDMPWRPVCRAAYETSIHEKLSAASEVYQLVYGQKPETMALLKSERPRELFTEEFESVMGV
jgi:hypothetical protein